MHELIQPPTTLYPGRVRQTLLLLVGVAFTVVGVSLVRHGIGMGYLVAGFLGLALVVFVVNCLPSASYLRLEQDSFTFCSLFRAHTVRWDDVQEFGILHIGSTRMVAWNFVPGFTGKGKMRSLNKSLAGYEAAIPDRYGMKLDDLLETMERLRREYWLRHGLA